MVYKTMFTTSDGRRFWTGKGKHLTPEVIHVKFTREVLMAAYLIHSKRGLDIWAKEDHRWVFVNNN